MKECPECKQENKGNGIYCSAKCRQKAYRKRVAELVKLARAGVLLPFNAEVIPLNNIPPYFTEAQSKGIAEKSNQSPSKQKKAAVKQEKAASSPTFKKGKNTYWGEIKKCRTKESVEAKRAEVNADATLNVLDVPFLNKACDNQLLNIKQ